MWGLEKDKIWILSYQLSVRDHFSHLVSTSLNMCLSQNALSRFPVCHMAHDFKSNELSPPHSPPPPLSLPLSHTHAHTRPFKWDVCMGGSKWGFTTVKAFIVIIAELQKLGHSRRWKWCITYLQTVCMHERKGGKVKWSWQKQYFYCFLVLFSSVCVSLSYLSFSANSDTNKRFLCDP